MVGDSHYSVASRQHIFTEGRDFHNIVGHSGTAAQLGSMLGIELPVNRESVKLQVGDVLYIAQPVGNRLDIGQEVDAPALKWFKVIIKPVDQYHRGYRHGFDDACRKYDPNWADNDGE